MRRAFTLIELLVVMVIIVALFAVIGVSMNGLLASGRVESGVTVVSTGVSAARAYAGRDIQFVSDLDPSTPAEEQADPPNGNGYSGAAVVFTPDGRLRLVENYEHARTPNGWPLEMGAVGSPWTDPLRSGYREIQGREPMSLPGGAAVVGIFRDTDDSEPKLLAPPFAVRFNGNGSLTPSNGPTDPVTVDDLVFYDGNQDGAYEINVHRYSPFGGGTYQPSAWLPDGPDYAGDYEPDDDETSPDHHQDTGRRKLPFEALEAVVGVIVYDFNAYTDAGHQPADVLDDSTPAARQWILDNGTPILINRQTGTVVNRR